MKLEYMDFGNGDDGDQETETGESGSSFCDYKDKAFRRSV